MKIQLSFLDDSYIYLLQFVSNPPPKSPSPQRDLPLEGKVNTELLNLLPGDRVDKAKSLVIDTLMVFIQYDHVYFPRLHLRCGAGPFTFTILFNSCCKLAP